MCGECTDLHNLRTFENYIFAELGYELLPLANSQLGGGGEIIGNLIN